MSIKRIPVIDLFAGPGGLAEGFSSLQNKDIEFRIVLSIEKDRFAHETLELRSFFRQFPRGEIPDEYYRYVRGEHLSSEELFNTFPEQARRARREAWRAELGATGNDEVDRRIEEALEGETDWVLIGGPPCQAYSTAGRSRRRRDESFRTDEKHTLYRHYLRIIARHCPAMFVMENVKGLLSSKLEEEWLYPRLQSDLEDPCAALETGATSGPKYRLFSFSRSAVDIRDNPRSKPQQDFFAALSGNSVRTRQLKAKDFIVECEHYGIPQARHRVLFFGIRTDRYTCIPPVLDQLPEVTVRKVLSDLPPLRSRLSRQRRVGEPYKEIKDSPESRAQEIVFLTKEAVAEGLSDDLIWSRMLRALKKLSDHRETGGRFVPSNPDRLNLLGEMASWYLDEKLGGFLNHETRPHMGMDLLRYLYLACRADIEGASPKLHEFPKFLLPEHQNASKAVESRHGHFNDRFRVQVPEEPARTVTSHISRDGHYFIHYDPAQCRSLTVREAARLQTFPDNYFFEGPRSQQYQQVGNAVPPLLAYRIAEIVARVFGELIDSNDSSKRISSYEVVA